MDRLYEGMQYWRRDGTVSPPLVPYLFMGKRELLRDPETKWAFEYTADRRSIGRIWRALEDKQDLVAPYIPYEATEEALQALL